MTTRKANIIILILVGLYIIYSIIYPIDPKDGVKSNLLSIAINIFSGAILYGLLQLFQNINKLWFYFQTMILYRKKEIRLSIAYLFRIKVGNQYLLIKSRTRNYFQPVGGVFKTLPGSEKIFEKLQIKPDRLIETEKGIAKGDLRVFVKGLNIVEFLEWFNSKEDRETSPWREFCEELVSTEILQPATPFRYIDYKFKGTVKTPILNLDSGDKGLFIYEIYDLVINSDQEPILHNLQKEGNTEKYIWVEESLINRLGHDEKTKKYTHEIAPHTKWALNLKWSKSR